MRNKKSLQRNNIPLFIFSLIVAIVCLLPIYLLFINASRSTEEIRQGISFLPGTHLFHNIKGLTSKGFPLIRGFLNSTIISFSATALSMYFSALTAFAFVTYKFRFKKQLFTMIMIIIIMPSQLGMIGFYSLVVDLGLYDTWIPLIIPSIASATTVFFFKQYMEANFSYEIVESARMDGASEFMIFNRMALPLIGPAVSTMAIFSIVGNWNNYMGPLLILSSEELFTLPMLVELLKTDIYSTDLGAVYAGIFITVVPLLIIYAIFAKRIVGGIALGGVKE